jgi:ubiquinone/menaquinone biosynthesis C-methylase UbiE
MSTNQAYLRNDQYRTSNNLDARVRLHELYSTNKYGWHPWVFDQLLPLAPQSRLLELGAGPAYLWANNLARLPQAWQVTLSDYSLGMMQQARGKLAPAGAAFRYLVVDAQRIPCPDATFDTVIANHMLYHVPQRALALGEIRRVLRPGGRLIATTVGQTHLRELWAWTARFAPQLKPWQVDFTLEDGAAQLAPFFGAVELRRHEDALVITEAAPLVDYILSTQPSLSEAQRAALSAAVERELAARGSIHITKDSGMFLAVRG